jgi:hypothetical protein
MPRTYRFKRGFPVYPGDLVRIVSNRIVPADSEAPDTFRVPDDAQIEASCIGWMEER